MRRSRILRDRAPMMKSFHQRSVLVALALAASGLTASCNSNQPRWSTNPTFNDPVGSLALALDQPLVQIPQGGSGMVNATVTPSGGFTGLIQFSPIGGARLGITLSPDSIDIEGTAPVTVPLTITATNASAVGNDNITIAAAASNQAAEAPLSVNAVAP
jgi:hypothetical protein